MNDLVKRDVISYSLGLDKLRKEYGNQIEFMQWVDLNKGIYATDDKTLLYTSGLYTCIAWYFISEPLTYLAHLYTNKLTHLKYQIEGQNAAQWTADNLLQNIIIESRIMG